MTAEPIEAYNSLVSKWNSKYATDGKCQYVSEDEFVDSIIERLKILLFSDKSTGRQKVKHTVTTLQVYAYVTEKPPEDDSLTKNELAVLITMKGKEVLNQY